jgi:glycosyltransferase involved in cell wall biosynthesis
LPIASQRKLIIVLNNLMSEGTPKMALDICRHCVAEGVAPVILTLEPAIDEIGHHFRGLGAVIEPVRLPSRGYRRFATLALASARAVRRHRADAVLSMPFGWHAFIAIGAWLAGARHVVAHVGNHPGGTSARNRKLLRWMVRLGRPFTHSLACCSDYVRRGIVDLLGVRVEDTSVIYNGAALDEVAARADAARPNRARATRRRLVMTARYEVHKDQATLIRALGLLSDSGENLELVLVGDGSRRGELERLVAELGLGERVDLAGFRDDVPEQLGLADLFVFSTTPDEGLGIALIEAMAAGTPIVASDVGACRETLDGNQCGLLVAPGDPHALATGIRRALNDRDATEARRTAAQARAAALFSSRAMFENYMALLMPAVPASLETSILAPAQP